MSISELILTRGDVRKSGLICICGEVKFYIRNHVDAGQDDYEIICSDCGRLV